MDIALPKASGLSSLLARPFACRLAALIVALIALTPAVGAGQSRLAPARGVPPVLAATDQAQVQPPSSERPHPAAPSWGGRYHPRYGRWWPGQTLPPDAGATVIADPAHYHLRRAPAGYVWFLCDGDLVLASSSSGLIVEVIPGGGG